ncbi:putative phosphatidylglycerophosphatase (fragment) [Bacillus sp. 349Y]
MPKTSVPSNEVTKAALRKLEERGVALEDIADIVYQMQYPYNGSLTMEDCLESVRKVLLKREIQHAILVGVELDQLAERKMLSEPLQSIVASDEGLFGVDETIALGAALG